MMRKLRRIRIVTVEQDRVDLYRNLNLADLAGNLAGEFDARSEPTATDRAE